MFVRLVVCCQSSAPLLLPILFVLPCSFFVEISSVCDLVEIGLSEANAVALVSAVTHHKRNVHQAVQLASLGMLNPDARAVPLKYVVSALSSSSPPPAEAGESTVSSNNSSGNDAGGAKAMERAEEGEVS